MKLQQKLYTKIKVLLYSNAVSLACDLVVVGMEGGRLLELTMNTTSLIMSHVSVQRIMIQLYTSEVEKMFRSFNHNITF